MDRLSASAAIPLWAEDFSDVLPDMPEIELELEYSMERIPNAFMTLAEIYLATRATEEGEDNLHGQAALGDLLDACAGTQGSL